MEIQTGEYRESRLIEQRLRAESAGIASIRLGKPELSPMNYWRLSVDKSETYLVKTPEGPSHRGVSTFI